MLKQLRLQLELQTNETVYPPELPAKYEWLCSPIQL